MPKNTVTVRKLEVPRNVVNHEGRGDARGVPTRAELDFQREADKKTNEQLRADADAESRQDAIKANHPMMMASLEEWFEDRPEFAKVDKRDDKTARENKEAMWEELHHNTDIRTQMQRDGRVTWNYWDFEQAFQACMRKGKLKLDEGELHKQRRAAVRAQLSPEQEDEAYSMPLHELRRLGTPGSYDPLGPK